jgi:hypothetical protein
MKKILPLLALLTAPAWALAEKWAFDTTRVFEQTYAVTAADILEIRNRYGEISITTWDQPDISVKVTIEAGGSDPVRVRELMDQVSVRERRFGAKIQLETLAPVSGWMGIPGRQGLKIRFEVQAPAANSLEMEQKFGKIDLGDREGNVDITIEQGELTAHRLAGFGNRIKVSAAKATFDEIGGGDIFFSAGDLQIKKAGQLILEASAGRVWIGKVAELQLTGSLGEVHADTVGSLSGTFNSGRLTVENLSGKMDMDARFATRVEVNHVLPGFTGLNLTGEFSSFALGFDPNAVFDLDAQMENGEITTYLADREIRRSRFADRVEVVQTLPEDNARRATPPPAVHVSGKFGSIRIRQ